MAEKNYLSVRIGNFVAFVAVVVINMLAVLLPINGVTPQAISDKYANLFAPAGITFSIWSVIYVLLALFALYGLGVFKGKGGASLDAVKRIGPWFIISSAANVAWIFAWHYDVIPLSMALMILLLVSLIAAYLRIRREPLTHKEKWLVLLPISVYFGWITIATVANVTVLLVSMGVQAMGPAAAVWTIVILIVALAIGAAVVLKFNDIAYGLVLAWAYLGILIKHMTEPFARQYPAVITALIILLIAGVAVIVLAGVRGRKKLEMKN